MKRKSYKEFLSRKNILNEMDYIPQQAQQAQQTQQTRQAQQAQQPQQAQQFSQQAQQPQQPQQPQQQTLPTSLPVSANRYLRLAFKEMLKANFDKESAGEALIVSIGMLKRYGLIGLKKYDDEDEQAKRARASRLGLGVTRGLYNKMTGSE